MENRPQIMWFKRDLRLADHAALTAAASAGPVLPLHVIEPDYWALPDTAHRHYVFQAGALADLRDRIAAGGGTLDIRTGTVSDVLDDLHDALGPFDLHAHEETGNAWTHARDVAVHAWCREHGVSFHEVPQYGIRRGSLLNRDRWAKDWDKAMSRPLLPVPDVDWLPATARPIPEPESVGLEYDGLTWMQEPGRDAALETLRTFLYERGETYQRAMSNPLSGADACSRLSTHLTAGSLSMRECFQATLERQAEVEALPKETRGDWPKALKSFVGRLHWHCHFMQKLEAEPELEWRPMARAYEGLRPSADPDVLCAYAEGRTGYPFVDACMRSLIATGWINFRMRAMLMSFASYDLWLPWQQSGAVLARLFTDYEPGIHWTQSQMQSGETGINAVRIYSPVKQGYDQDPEAEFIRRWVPELAHLTGKDIHEPWRLDKLPEGYPERIVDHGAAVARAKTAIYAIRRKPEARAEAEAVYARHGSRKPRKLRQPPKKKSAGKKNAA